MPTVDAQCDPEGKPEDAIRQEQEYFMKEALLMVFNLPLFFYDIG